MQSVFIGILLLAVLICICIIYHDTHHFYTVYYRMTHPKLTKSLRIVVLADLHETVYGEGNIRLMSAVKELKPDLILVAGDMVTADTKTDFSSSASLLKALAGEFPVYYGMGNHESRIAANRQEYGGRYEAYRQELTDAGVVFLQNENVVLSKYNIVVHGLELEECYYYKLTKRKLPVDYMEAKAGSAGDSYFHILVAHNPDFFPQYAGWGADLVVSGHVHGGIVRLPLLGGVISTSFRLFPKYDGGLFSEKESSMIISRGLGSHTIPLRMFNPGECVVIDMKPGEVKDVHICKAGEI